MIPFNLWSYPVFILEFMDCNDLSRTARIARISSPIGPGQAELLWIALSSSLRPASCWSPILEGAEFDRIHWNQGGGNCKILRHEPAPSGDHPQPGRRLN